MVTIRKNLRGKDRKLLHIDVMNQRLRIVEIAKQFHDVRFENEQEFVAFGIKILSVIPAMNLHKYKSALETLVRIASVK